MLGQKPEIPLPGLLAGILYKGERPSTQLFSLSNKSYGLTFEDLLLYLFFLWQNLFIFSALLLSGIKCPNSPHTFLASYLESVIYLGISHSFWSKYLELVFALCSCMMYLINR